MEGQCTLSNRPIVLSDKFAFSIDNLIKSLLFYTNFNFYLFMFWLCKNKNFVFVVFAQPLFRDRFKFALRVLLRGYRSAEYENLATIVQLKVLQLFLTTMPML